MKQWNNNDLILFYYGEIDRKQNNEIQAALVNSIELQQKYTQLCDFLDNKTDIQIPPANANLNQKIIAAVHQQIDMTATHLTVKNSTLSRIGEWIFGTGGRRIIGASLATTFVVLSAFYLGSGSMLLSPPAHLEQQVKFSNEESQRVLISNVSSHMEISERLFTLVSNGNGDLPLQIESRRQNIEDLVALNRIYRRLVKNSGDKTLVQVLQQMESILVELNNTDQSTSTSELNNIQNRLSETDLIYQLKVITKKLEQKLV